MKTGKRLVYLIGLVILGATLIWLGVETRGRIVSFFLIIPSLTLFCYVAYLCISFAFPPETQPEWSVPHQDNPEGYRYDYPTSEYSVYNVNLPTHPGDFQSGRRGK